MPEDQNKLSRFWHELKRRNVVRVITVYAGAAFVILQLVDIIREPLRLPAWLLPVVIILLSIGLILTVIFSWIYNVLPEGGLVKAGPAPEEKEGKDPSASNNWKIASYISFVLILGLIVLNIIPRSGTKKIRDKSIAILPFINDSPDQERMYFINGTMESILDDLSKIKDLRVVSRTSVEQYRENPKPIPVVAEEMNVSYVLEGSGHRDGEHVRLIVQLLDGKRDQHIWSKTYDANIEEIFSLQSKIAQKIAGEIEAIITPEEKALIERIPTESQTAYDLSLKAWELRVTDPPEAEKLYRISLEYDSTFTWPYVGLGWIYFTMYNNTTEYQPACLDSIRKFISKAMFYDEQESRVYDLRGAYYHLLGENDRALEDYNRALELNPNLASSFVGKADMAFYEKDYLGAIENFHKAVSVDRGPDLSYYYRTLSYLYFLTGFEEQSNLYSSKALELSGDSAQYYFEQARIEIWLDYDLKKAQELLERGYGVDSNNVEILYHLGFICEITGRYEESLEYFEKYVDQFSDPGEISVFNKNAIAFAYLRNGLKKKADMIFDEQKNYMENRLALGEKSYPFYGFLAQIYELQGDKEKAFENLRSLNQVPYGNAYNNKENLALDTTWLRSMRNDPDFKQIIDDMDAKYQAEHERVRQWLEENDRL